ncbi:MAG: hypothetical protein R3E31_13020 [Chloroflexota bacterium]
MKRDKSSKLTRILMGLVFVGIVTMLAQSGARAAAVAPADLPHQAYLPIIANETSGSEPGDGSFQIYAYSDAAVLLPNEYLQPQLTAQKAQVCTATAVPAALSLSQALQNGWQYLAQQVGPANLAQFRSAPELATAAAAQAFAMAALIDNRPDGALAGLLLAQEHAPQSRIVLINTAGMFASLDMPNEALALLNAAQNLPDDEATPMGIPSAELAANTRGFALLAQGQWAAAEAVLRPLVEGETELAEARTNLSKALLCQNKEEEATRYYRAGSRRMLWDEVHDGSEIEGTHIPTDLTLNRSAGKLFTLPPLGTTSNPAQAQALANHLFTLINQSISRSTERQALIEANMDARDARPLPGPLTWSRFHNIYITANRAEYEPDIQELYFDVVTQEDTINELRSYQDEEFLELYELYPDHDAFIGACRNTVTRHLGEMLAEYGEFENLLETYTEAKYAAMTSVAANLADELNHEYVSLLIEDSMETDIAWRLHVLSSQINTIASNWAVCEGAEEAATTQPSDPTFEWAARCPDALTRNKLSITFLDMVQIKANCEILEVELSGPGLLTIFGQVTVNFKDKTTTFFAGGKIKGPIGLGELGINEGFYVKAGADGIQDVGMKVSTGVDVKAGQFSGVVDGPEIEFGVAPAIEYLGGLITTP